MSGADSADLPIKQTPAKCRLKRCVTVSSEPIIFTVGHSTRSIAEFVDLLQRGPVNCVVDVRTVPRSRRNPQYNEDVLGAELAQYQIGYARIAALGGLRGKSPGVPPEVNGFWDNQSFHNYADYALTPSFASALDQLLQMSSRRSCAIMCAEAVWWRCHRRIIADYLLVRGRPVFHLMGHDRVEPAHLTIGAKIEGSTITYPSTLVEAQ
jgi:uncharacterized protein (DUF488 family)